MSLAYLEQLIRTRRSVRRYQERAVPEDVLLKAVELATWAPSSGGKQGWHFHVVTNQTVITAVADAVLEVTHLMGTWPESEPVRSAIERWKVTSAFFRSAPALVAVSMADYVSATDQVTRARASVDPVAAEIVEARRIGASRLQTAAGATAYLLLALHAMGLGAVWMAGPQQAKRAIEQILSIPPQHHFVALIPVGYPAEQPAPRPRKDLSQMVTIIR